jgi:hypothetical protein
MKKTCYQIALEISAHRRLPLGISELTDLARAEKTLHRWSELECGDGNDFASWSIERDEQTGTPYMVTHPHSGKSYRTKVADREKGALKRVAAICKAAGLHFYHQGDPRGCSLYVSTEPLDGSNYSRGVAIC